MNPDHRPKLSESNIEQALEAMRTGQPLVDHPLCLFLTILNRLSSPHTLLGDAAVQVAVFKHLGDVITQHLGIIRQIHHLTPPHPTGPIDDLKRDFQQGNTELEAWSLLYHRYVCVDRAFSMQRLAAETHQDERTLRRRQNLGVTRLTHELIELEQLARQAERQSRLRLALPQTYIPTLVGFGPLIKTARHLLTQTDPPHHLIVHGPAGIGKTALALAIAHTWVGDDEPQIKLDDILWLDMPNLSTEIDTFTRELITRLGLPLRDVNPQQILRGYLSTHHVLFVLDGADDLLNKPDHAEAILLLLDLAYVILTGRGTAPSHLWFSHIMVPELNREAALQLVDLLADHDSAHYASLLRRFEIVWEIVGGNPFALKILLNSAHLPPGTAVEQVEIQKLHLHAWKQLLWYERQIWLLPLLFPGDGLRYDQIRPLVQLDDRSIGAAVNTLTQAALMMTHTRHDMPCYTLSTITKTFLMDQIISDESTRVFFHNVCERMVNLLVDSPDPATAVFLLKLADELEFSHSDCRQYAFLLADQIVEAGLWQAWSERLIPLLEREQDPICEAWLSGMLGTALRWVGQTAEAERYLRHALTLHPYHSPESANLAVELAVIYRYQGQWQEAHRLLQDAHEIYNQVKSPVGIERSIYELSQLSLEAQDPIHALTILSKSESWSARAWGIASQAYLALGQFDDALQAARRALDLLPVYHPNQGRILATLGQIYHAKGELAKAVDYLHWAIDLLVQSKDALGYARVCNNLAAVYLSQNPSVRSISLEEIRQLLEQALQIQEQTGDEIGLTTTRQNLAWLNITRGSS